MDVEINNFSFSAGGMNFLDVEVHHSEQWIELKIETSESFPIDSQQELDLIYQKLSEIFTQFKSNSVIKTKLIKSTK